jgi:hypothetical protein
MIPFLSLQNSILNEEYYTETLKKLTKRIRRKELKVGGKTNFPFFRIT